MFWEKKSMITIQAKAAQLTTQNKKRIPRNIEYTVDNYPVKLHTTKAFWNTAVNIHLDYELIPHIYRYILSHGLHKKEHSLVFTNCSMVIHCKLDEDQICLDKVYRLNKALSQKNVKEKGYILLQPTLDLWMDKHFHFLKRYAKRKFDLTLIVPAYFKAKSMMPNDRVRATDGNSTLIIAKKDATTLVLVTGMKNGEIDWDEYLDTKMVM